MNEWRFPRWRCLGSDGAQVGSDEIKAGASPSSRLTGLWESAGIGQPLRKQRSTPPRRASRRRQNRRMNNNYSTS